jgi:hypothetical protein
MKKMMDDLMHELVENVKAQPWEDSAFYQEYLAQSYYYTFYSVKMLAHAASLTTVDQTSYYKRSIEHIKEEYGHDSLALTDLKRLGGTIDDHPELGVTRALYEPQFYKIQRQPTALLGYILALEYLCVTHYKELFKRLEKTYGVKCTNFIRVHAEDDPDHVEKAIAQIKSLPEHEQEAVWKNYEQTCRMFAGFLNECKFRSAQRSGRSDKKTPGLRLVS